MTCSFEKYDKSVMIYDGTNGIDFVKKCLGSRYNWYINSAVNKNKVSLKDVSDEEKLEWFQLTIGDYAKLVHSYTNLQGEKIDSFEMYSALTVDEWLNNPLEIEDSSSILTDKDVLYEKLKYTSLKLHFKEMVGEIQNYTYLTKSVHQLNDNKLLVVCYKQDDCSYYEIRNGKMYGFIVEIADGMFNISKDFFRIESEKTKNKLDDYQYVEVLNTNNQYEIIGEFEDGILIETINLKIRTNYHKYKVVEVISDYLHKRKIILDNKKTDWGKLYVNEVFSCDNKRVRIKVHIYGYLFNYGILNENLEQIIPFIYKDIVLINQSNNELTFLCYENTLFMGRIVDQYNNLIVESQSIIDYGKYLSYVDKYNDNKLGFIDKNCQIIIKPQYKNCEDVEYNSNLKLFKVSIDGELFGYVNKSNEVIIPLIYNNIDTYYYNNNYLEYGSSCDRMGFMTKKGDIICEAKYNISNGMVFDKNEQAFITSNNFLLIYENGVTTITNLTDKTSFIIEDLIFTYKKGKNGSYIFKNQIEVVQNIKTKLYGILRQDGTFAMECTSPKIIKI